MILYHGGTEAVMHPDCKKGRPDLDFGQGFYVMQLQDQAQGFARRAFSGNMYDKVQDPNLICALTGHKEGSKAFARYRKIDEDTNRKTVSLLEQILSARCECNCLIDNLLGGKVS